MVSALRLLPRYLIRFNLFHGFLNFVQLELFRLNKCRLKGVRGPIYMRPKSSDIKVFREIFLYNSYDISRPEPKIIVDAGSNIGLASVYLASKFSESKIYAVEPDKDNFKMLCKNTKNYESIIPILSALWSKDTYLKIKNLNDDSWTFTVEESVKEDSSAFLGLSINTLMAQYGIECIDILKLDIEGSERELFSNNYSSWISCTKCILIELHDWIDIESSRTVFKTMANFNFSTTIFNGMLMMINEDLK